MKQLSLFLLIVMLPILASAQQTLDPKFEKKIEGLIDHSVPVISCERLEKKMSTPNLYLLDAREKKEFETSHLEDAVWVGYNTFSPESLADVPKDGIVVVYCSVGYRSEKIGEKLNYYLQIFLNNIFYQLAFVIPGIRPADAISLNVTRDIPNCLI